MLMPRSSNLEHKSTVMTGLRSWLSQFSGEMWFSGRGAARAEDAEGTPAESHTSPSNTKINPCVGLILRGMREVGETCPCNFHPLGWLRASALPSRLISLVGVKWSCSRINTQASPFVWAEDACGNLILICDIYYMYIYICIYSYVYTHIYICIYLILECGWAEPVQPAQPRVPAGLREQHFVEDGELALQRVRTGPCTLHKCQDYVCIYKYTYIYICI